MMPWAVVLWLVLAAPAWAAPRDGAWWGSAPESFKLGYVAGYLAGRDEQSSRWRQLTEDAAAQLPAEARAQFEPILDALRGDASAFEAVTYGDVVAQIDRFYTPEKNRTIPLEQALTVVRQSLAGVDQQYLYCQVEYFRLAHDAGIPMKERIESLGQKAAQCADMSPHPDAAPQGGYGEDAALPPGHPQTK